MSDVKKPMKKVSGLVSDTDRPWWLKIRNLFFAESFTEVKRNLVKDVVVPYVKNFIADSLITAIQRSIFGDSAPRTGSTYRSWGGSSLARPGVSKASYETYYKKAQISDVKDDLYDPIIMRSWAKGQELIEVLQDRINEYDHVTVNELNASLVNEDGDSRIGKVSDPYFGWKSLEGYSIVQISPSEWEVKLPKPIELSKKGRTIVI